MLPIDPITSIAIVLDPFRKINRDPAIADEDTCREKYNCRNCKAHPNYQLDTIKKTPQADINQELKLHNHPSSRKMPEGNMRRTDEGRAELYNHTIKFDKRFFNLD
jgi:hypothetical protein